MPAGPYEDPAALAAYERHRHSGATSPNTVMEEPALRRHLGDVRGLRVADLGCGDAAIGADLLDAGCAEYYGIDASPGMVELARARLEGRNATIEVRDLTSFGFPPDRFDLVISRLALHYVADVAPVLAACRACLSPGGSIVLTVVHPVLTAHDGGAPGRRRTSWLVDDYFVRGERRRPWFGTTVTWHHRTVEDWVALLLGAGFVLEALSECAPERALFHGDEAEFARRLRVPLFLLLAARRAGETGGGAAA